MPLAFAGTGEGKKAVGGIVDIFGGKEVDTPPTVGQNLQTAIRDVQGASTGLNELQSRDLDNAIAQFKRSQPDISEAELDILRRFGPLFQAESLESFQRAANELQGQFNQSDPLAAELRDTLLQQALEGLRNPTGLDPSLQREVEQGVRSAQTARGTSQGNASVTAEAFARGQVGEQLRNNRVNAAQSILRTNQATGFSQNQALPFTNFSQPSGGQVGDFQNPLSSASLLPGIFNSQGQNNALQSNIQQFNNTRSSRAIQNIAALGSSIGSAVAGGGGA